MVGHADHLAGERRLAWLIGLAALIVGLVLGCGLVFVLTLLSERHWYLGIGLLIAVSAVVLFETMLQRTFANFAQPRLQLSEDDAAEIGRKLALVARFAAAAGIAVVLLTWTKGAF